MKAYGLTEPIKNKIETYVKAYFTAKGITAAMDFFDYEPSEGMVNTIKKDGAIAVFFKSASFPHGSNTGTQKSANQLCIDCYGVGRPIKDDDTGLYAKTVREAQKRSEILTSLSYDAVMDRGEYEGQYDTEIEFDNKMPTSIERFSPMGPIVDGRGFCMIRTIFQLDFEEEPPVAVKTGDYSGSDWDLVTYFKGDEEESSG